MSEQYRLVLLDANGREVGSAQTLTMQPGDLLVIMPPSDQSWSSAYVARVTEALEQQHVHALVLKLPAQIVRLERIDDRPA